MGEGSIGSSEIVARLIDSFRSSIPRPNRREAIREAKEKREALIMNLWQKERERLPQDVVDEKQLTNNLAGWERYLQLTFEADGGEGDLGEWEAKYTAQMLLGLRELEERNGQSFEELIPFGKRIIMKQYGRSFQEYYLSGFVNYDPAIWRGTLQEIDDKSLLIHSISKEALKKVIISGVVGKQAPVAMSQDRIISERDYVIVFQANELRAARYRLLKVGEDPRDAQILKEWRSPLPIDINLARLIVPISEIPDRANAPKTQIATSYFGEDYLRGIERL